MKQFLSIGVLVAAVSAVAPAMGAQAPPQNSNPPANSQSNHPQLQNTQNPFPEDTHSVPIMPTSGADIPADTDKSAIPLPADDADPVRTPEQAAASAEGDESSSSSSRAGLGDFSPGPDDDAAPGKHGKKGSDAIVEHQETAKGDEDVGKYYLDQKNWKAALSRFQSALVLDPDNPDVYWGLAEAQRHLGDAGDARANYQKVVDYDPDSHRGKDARKMLKDPDIANAKQTKPAAAVAPAPVQ